MDAGRDESVPRVQSFYGVDQLQLQFLGPSGKIGHPFIFSCEIMIARLFDVYFKTKKKQQPPQLQLRPPLRPQPRPRLRQLKRPMLHKARRLLPAPSPPVRQ